MLIFVSAACCVSFLSALPLAIASAVPTPSKDAAEDVNSTGCAVNCQPNPGNLLGSPTGSARHTTVTITAETLVYVVNKKSNSTSMTTITNTELDRADTRTTSGEFTGGDTTETEFVSITATSTSTEKDGAITRPAVFHVNPITTFIESTGPIALQPGSLLLPPDESSSHAGGNAAAMNTGSSAPEVSGDMDVSSTTSPIAAAPQPPNTPAPFIINSQTLTTNSQSQYLIADSTLIPNQPLILTSNTSTLSVLLQISDSHPVLIYGSTTATLIPNLTTPAVSNATPPAITVGSQVVTANPQHEYIFGNQTLVPGGTINLDGTTITAPAVADTPPPITIGSQVVTANAQDQYFVGSQTLTPGGAIDVSGTPVSLAPGGTQVVVGTSSVGLGPYIFGGLGARPSGGPGNGTAGTVPSLESADGALKGARWSVGALGVLMGLVVWL